VDLQVPAVAAHAAAPQAEALAAVLREVPAGLAAMQPKGVAVAALAETSQIEVTAGALSEEGDLAEAGHRGTAWN